MTSGRGSRMERGQQKQMCRFQIQIQNPKLICIAAGKLNTIFKKSDRSNVLLL